ncbi:MAG TPA: LPXTG cell wall anchor domain-containing protein, partial [Ilumatobacteraceae bacterium]|nr:LPXTG cell wall anchor domain-containing protein [Ilumatobacteraceae bacterium]
MRFVSASNGGTAAGQTVTWKKLPSLEPGASVTLTLTTQVISTQAGSFRNWAEISADSSSTYGPDVHDKDSTPDTTTGSDQTLPNDPYVGIDDLGLIDTDGLPGGDEDDNDDAVVVVSAVIPPPTGPTTVPSTTPTTAPSTTPTTPTTVPFTGTTQPTGTLPKTGTDSTGLIGWAGLITALGAGLWLATRRRRTAGQR